MVIMLAVLMGNWMLYSGSIGVTQLNASVMNASVPGMSFSFL